MNGVSLPRTLVKMASGLLFGPYVMILYIYRRRSSDQSIASVTPLNEGKIGVFVSGVAVYSLEKQYDLYNTMVTISVDDNGYKAQRTVPQMFYVSARL